MVNFENQTKNSKYKEKNMGLINHICSRTIHSTSDILKLLKRIGIRIDSKKTSNFLALILHQSQDAVEEAIRVWMYDVDKKLNIPIWEIHETIKGKVEQFTRILISRKNIYNHIPLLKKDSLEYDLEMTDKQIVDEIEYDFGDIEKVTADIVEDE